MHPSLSGWLRRHGVEHTFSLLASLYPRAGVFVVDADRNVIFWSEGAERLLGYTGAEVLGAHCLKGARCARCVEGCGIAEHTRVEDVPLQMFRADGAMVRVRKWAQALFDADGRFAGGIEVLVPDEAEAPAPEAGVAGAEFHGLVSRDPGMLRVFQTIRNVAETEASVLVRGESGTGKELVARAIHLESHRRAGPFVAVNCAALSPTLIESELFGHARGAFTGAVSDRVGIFAQADRGTLFLDEVAELPLEVQAKLLRVLQERSFSPVGSSKVIKVDVRVVAATHRALREEVRAGRFREDLMFRLRVVPLFLPPLRERRMDVELLLKHFIDRNNARGPRRVARVAPDAMRRLLDYSWPGNVRELQNVMDYAFAVGRGPELACEDLPPEIREEGRRAAAATPLPAPSAAGRERDEEAELREALERAGGHVGEAAASLGISRPTFWRKRRKYGI